MTCFLSHIEYFFSFSHFYPLSLYFLYFLLTLSISLFSFLVSKSFSFSFISLSFVFFFPSLSVFPFLYPFSNSFFNFHSPSLSRSLPLLLRSLSFFLVNVRCCIFFSGKPLESPTITWQEQKRHSRQKELSKSKQNMKTTNW